MSGLSSKRLRSVITGLRTTSNPAAPRKGTSDTIKVGIEFMRLHFITRAIHYAGSDCSDTVFAA